MKFSTERLLNWIDHRLPVVTFFNKELKNYPTPKNLNFLWNFGSLAGICLVIMILSGIFLAMHYVPHVEHAFDSVERIMRDVNGGWLIRYILIWQQFFGQIFKLFFAKIQTVLGNNS